MIDCHAHLTAHQFENDLKEIILRAKQAGVQTIAVVGENFQDSKKVLTICSQHAQFLRPCIGFHPDNFSENRVEFSDKEIEQIFELIEIHRSDIIGIGEVGLDYWSVKTEEQRSRQRAFLSKITDLANELALPLNVHSRSAGHYALDLLASCNAGKVLMHAFDGKARFAREAADAYGWLFSIPPSVVRSSQKQKLVRALPLSALALESDSPALGPEPQIRNEPANLIHAVRLIAEIKGESEKTVREVTSQNAQKLFNI
jgi:TatD DNase family protein